MRASDQELAERVGKAMYAADAASRALGIRLLAIAPGFARMEMSIRSDMLNGHKICHGGLLFSLADSAFAFACNTSNITTVAAGCSIDFLVPAQQGDLLTAEARECAHTGRSGVYDIVISNQRGETVALFRGRSRQLKTRVIPADSDTA
jgi:acyl-CoA thioesterase